MAFAGVAREVERLRPQLLDAVTTVLDSGRFLLGEQLACFEHELAENVGAAHAVGVGSGTDAIELALRALALEPGDEVVTQANTCVPTVAAIERAGAMPVLCDVDRASGTMSAASLEAAAGPRTRAVVVVHLYGQCAEMVAISAVAAQLGVPVVEDCAQAHGADYRGRAAGTMGAMGCFSFYPTKNLGALGDGGAVVTGDAGLAERVRRLRVYGQEGAAHSTEPGVSSRLDELQAALLRVKLPGLEEAGHRRREIAARYDAALAGTAVRPLATLPDTVHARHLYVVDAPDRDRFRDALAKRGIETLVHYERPVHGHAAYAALAHGPAPLAAAEELARRVVSLPSHPLLSDEEVGAVAEAAREAAADQEAA